jgi:hypothetical protein
LSRNYPSRRSLLYSALALRSLRASAADTTPLNLFRGNLDIHLDSGHRDLSDPELFKWISDAAQAVARYYGAFPVPRARLRVAFAAGRRGVRNGRSFGDDGALTTITVGEHATPSELKDDWILTHEMVHWAFPSVAQRHHWIEEGSATYVEPIARSLAHNLTPARVWGDMLRDMHQGVPEPSETGLDNTDTWAATYWGGALFCLLADVEICQRTANAKGLEDAFRAIVKAGGNITADWPLTKAFEIGDQAIGGSTLQTLYQQMGLRYKQIDLPGLWRQLGVSAGPRGAAFDDTAPLAAVRGAILS